MAPLIYTLRHGLELLLKLLNLAASSVPGKISHHDISGLFAEARKTLESLDDASLLFAAEGLGIQKPLRFKYIPIMTGDLERIMLKYYAYEFLPEGKRPIADPKTELFRYPSSTQQGRQFTLSECSGALSPADVLTDVETVLDLLLSVYALVGRKEDGSHVLET
jgi:hypothetical protein